MSFAHLPAPHPGARPPPRHHGILPTRALHAGHDWGEMALERTWRSAAVLLLSLAFMNAFVARLPAALFMLTGIWAHFKGHPRLAQRLAVHPFIGGPLRWWLNRGRPLHPRQAPDTRPQM